MGRKFSVHTTQEQAFIGLDELRAIGSGKLPTQDVARITGEPLRNVYGWSTRINSPLKPHRVGSLLMWQVVDVIAYLENIISTNGWAR